MTDAQTPSMPGRKWYWIAGAVGVSGVAAFTILLLSSLSGLGDDVKEIAELRIALAKAELAEQVDYGVGKAKQGSVAGVLAILGACFLLVSLAVGLGWWLGPMFWGFRILPVMLPLGAGTSWLVLKPNPPTL